MGHAEQGSAVNARLRPRLLALFSLRGGHDLPVHRRSHAEVLLGPQRDPYTLLQEHVRSHAQARGRRRAHQLRLVALGLRERAGDANLSADPLHSHCGRGHTRAAHAAHEQAGGAEERGHNRTGNGGRPEAWLLQDRQHGRHARQHPHVQAVPAGQRGVRVALGRHVQRAEQHRVAQLERRLRGRSHRRRPLPGHHLHRPHPPLRRRARRQDDRAVGRGGRRRGVPHCRGDQIEASQQAADRLVHWHLCGHVHVRGAVRPRRLVRQRRRRAGHGQECGAEGGGRVRAQLVR